MYSISTIGSLAPQGRNPPTRGSACSATTISGLHDFVDELVPYAEPADHNGALVPSFVPSKRWTIPLVAGALVGGLLVALVKGKRR